MTTDSATASWATVPIMAEYLGIRSGANSLEVGAGVEHDVLVGPRFDVRRHGELHRRDRGSGREHRLSLLRSEGRVHFRAGVHAVVRGHGQDKTVISLVRACRSAIGFRSSKVRHAPAARLVTPKGPVVLVVMDGIGRGAGDEADAVAIAATPTLDRLWVPGARAELRAHGKAVGLPSDDDMGNSEVGHNALGAGKVYAQGAMLVGRAIASGALFEGATWQRGRSRAARAAARSTSSACSPTATSTRTSITSRRCSARPRRPAARSSTSTRCSTAATCRRPSALEYVDRIGAVSRRPARDPASTRGSSSGGGRMKITMDRYEADWPMVERGWHTHVLARARAVRVGDRRRSRRCAPRTPASSIRTCRAFVVEPAARRWHDGDACVMFNFRGDRAIEISRAFDDATFDKFDRVRRPDVLYAGMMEYDGDLHMPQHYLVTPPAIERPMGEILAAAHVSQLAISRDPEVRPRHVLLERQPQRHVRRRHRDLHRDPVATACRSSSGRG